jgi:hypothetical protein
VLKARRRPRPTTANNGPGPGVERFLKKYCGIQCVNDRSKGEAVNGSERDVDVLGKRDSLRRITAVLNVPLK